MRLLDGVSVLVWSGPQAQPLHLAKGKQPWPKLRACAATFLANTETVEITVFQLIELAFGVSSPDMRTIFTTRLGTMRPRIISSLVLPLGGRDAEIQCARARAIDAVHAAARSAIVDVRKCICRFTAPRSRRLFTAVPRVFGGGGHAPPHSVAAASVPLIVAGRPLADGVRGSGLADVHQSCSSGSAGGRSVTHARPELLEPPLRVGRWLVSLRVRRRGPAAGGASPVPAIRISSRPRWVVLVHERPRGDANPPLAVHPSAQHPRRRS